jgi:hypothetical protein
MVMEKMDCEGDALTETLAHDESLLDPDALARTETELEGRRDALEL